MALKSGRVGIHPSQVDPITGMLLVDPSGASDLSDLQDVDISDPAVGQLLVYDGNKWANEYSSISPLTPHILDDLQDVDITDPAGGQVLEYDADSEKWVNVYASISPTTPAYLASLQDVAITSIQNDQILRYDSTAGKWENEDMPSIPAAQVNSDWNATSGVAEILNKPTIPAAQVNSDWNAVSGVAEILNKPTIPAAQVNSDWNAVSGVAQILNKPTLPVITSAVTALTGATSATITNTAIHTTSIIEVFASVQMAQPTIATTEGQVILTFTALESDTDFKLRITN